jgi:hypothetical protein
MSVRDAWRMLIFACGLCAPLSAPLSARAQDCIEDSDCAAGFECDNAPSVGSSADCPPGGKCAPLPEPTPQPGECEPMELTCRTDDDCPARARCELRNNDCDSASAPASGPDSGEDSGQQSDSAGGAAPAEDRALPPPECEPPTEGECVFTLVECESTSECDGGDVCTALARSGRCSGGDPGAAPTPSCVGNGCPEPAPAPEPEPEPEPQEPVCTEVTISYCFPPPVDCSGGAACDAGARCVPLPEDVQEDAPAGWEGASALCLPEVWALAIEGRIELDGGGSSSGEDGVAQEGRSNNDKGVAASDDGYEGDASADDDCAVSSPGADGSRTSWPLFGCAALALVYGRRRARATHTRS